MEDVNGLVVALDGITIQHAGELLFDTPIPDSTVRAACVDSYLHSLGDVAFALLCGERFATSARIPKDPNRSDGRPAAEIVKDAFLKRLVEVRGVEVAGKPAPQMILEDKQSALVS